MAEQEVTKIVTTVRPDERYKIVVSGPEDPIKVITSEVPVINLHTQNERTVFTTSYSSLVGNGVNSEFFITHGLSSNNIIYQLYDSSSGNAVESDMSIINTNTIKISFDTIPTQDQYIIVVVA